MGDWMLEHPHTGTGTPDLKPKSPKTATHPCANPSYQGRVPCNPDVQAGDYAVSVTDSLDQTFQHATGPAPDGLSASYLTFSYAVGSGAERVHLRGRVPVHRKPSHTELFRPSGLVVARGSAGHLRLSRVATHASPSYGCCARVGKPYIKRSTTCLWWEATTHRAKVKRARLLGKTVGAVVLFAVLSLLLSPLARADSSNLRPNGSQSGSSGWKATDGSLHDRERRR